MSEVFTALRAVNQDKVRLNAAASLSEVALTTFTLSSSGFSAHKDSPGAQALHPEPYQEQAVYDSNQDEFIDDEEELTVTMSAIDFRGLEDRVARVVEVVTQERQALAAAEQRASKAEAELNQQAPVIAALQTELDALKSERLHARQHLSALLDELESLEF